MLKGKIYITNDINFCMTNLGLYRTIVIADEPDLFKIPGQIGGSILLPPYDAMAALVDESYKHFEYIYTMYLLHDLNVSKFIDIILQVLIAGTNIVFFIDPNGLRFEGVLVNFFLINFGIFIGNAYQPFHFDHNYIPAILNRLYANDKIDAKYFLQLYPNNLAFDQYIIRKLAYDCNLVFTNETNMGIQFKNRSTMLKGGLVQDAVRRLEK